MLVAKPDDSSGFDLTSSVDYAGFAVAIAVAGEASVVDRESAAQLSGLFAPATTLHVELMIVRQSNYTVFIVNRRSY